MEARQIINVHKPTAVTTTWPHCTPFSLPSNGVLTLGVSSVMTLTSDAVFKPECTGSSEIILTNSGTAPSAFTDFRDPFYASTIPECYALASTTVISYMLVIMLIITPRTFLHDGMVILGRRGFTNGPSGSDAGVGIGGRPWLQKVAALTVAISLTIATADTFRVAQQQYESGYMDAQALQTEVEDGTELKVIRVISDTFLWLAQAQTLIRLFPRQREKITIKWTAFALITLDVLFSILNNFVYKGNSRPHIFVDAVPALSYLFELALSLLYSAWVIYYAITNKRYAFYHPQMKNICLVALLSFVAVLVPTVFFVLDISNPDLAGWGDYVRWVGAAAASVVVWEWVERIEALERNEKKDGVLGREVFDGDEMLEVTPASESAWNMRRQNRKSGDDDSGGGATTGSNGKLWPGMATIGGRYRPKATTTHDIEKTANSNNPLRSTTKRIVARARPPLWPTRPPSAATPVSRADTASAESTVYAVRYHPITEATPPARDGDLVTVSRNNSAEAINILRGPNLSGDTILDVPEPERLNKPTTNGQVVVVDGSENPVQQSRTTPWNALTNVNPFKSKSQAPPPEVFAHATKPLEHSISHGSSSKWDVRGIFQEFAATQADKFREKTNPNIEVAPLPRTIIPAPPRRRNLQATLQDLEGAERTEVFHSERERRQPSPNFSSNGNSNSQQQRRLSDPCTPVDLNHHSIYQRGAISFAAADQEQHSRYNDEFLSPVSPINEQVERSVAFSSRSTTVQDRTHTLPWRGGLPVMSVPAPPRREGLPVMSIPAPPRQRRNYDDD